MPLRRVAAHSLYTADMTEIGRIRSGSAPSPLGIRVISDLCNADGHLPVSSITLNTPARRSSSTSGSFLSSAGRQPSMPAAWCQPDPAMDDCSVLRVKWRKGLRKRGFLEDMPVDTKTRLRELWHVPYSRDSKRKRTDSCGHAHGRGGASAGTRDRAQNSAAQPLARDGPSEGVAKRARGFALGKEEQVLTRGSALGGGRSGIKQTMARGNALGGRKEQAQEDADAESFDSAANEAAEEVHGAAASAPCRRRETVVDGSVRVYCDGAGRHNQDILVRHAGSGAWWGPDHELNISAPVQGGPTEQTNIRGELYAAVLATERDPRQLEICTDSEWLIERVARDLDRWRRYGWRRSLNGSRPDHVDLWKRLGRQLADPDRGAVHFRYVKAHSTEADVKAGRVTAADKRGNDAADEHAVAGAALHGVPRERVQAARRRLHVARAVQKMMLDVAWERARAREKLALPLADGAEEGSAALSPAGDQADPSPAPQPAGAPPPLGGAEFAARHAYPWGWDPPGARQRMPVARAN
eukprot:gene19341-biopygen11769